MPRTVTLSRKAIKPAVVICAVLLSLQVLGEEMSAPEAVPARAPSPSATETPLQEVIVTARKQTERLQDVPMSVAAVSAQDIQKTGAISLSDLGHEVAGLTVVSAAPGQNVITLRGLSGNNTVGFYIDDTPLTLGIGNAVQPTNYDMDPALFDLSRVEVLRGPQGTLYGAAPSAARFATSRISRISLRRTPLRRRLSRIRMAGGSIRRSTDS